MFHPITRRRSPWAMALLVLGLAACGRPAPQATRLRISLDTGPTHIRNETVRRFTEVLERQARGRLHVDLYESGQLYRGRDVAKALAQGAIDLGLPGLWQLGTIVPEASVTMLPMFYGVSPQMIHQIVDGDLGRELNAALEERLRVRVIGKYLDLGYSTVFSSSRRVSHPSDLAGLRIRVAGGAADVLRLAELGAAPVALSFSDVPLALAQGAIDGLQSSHETVRSARLWEAGVRYGYDDRQTFYQYVPMIGQAFWDRLPVDLRRVVHDAWAETVEAGRAAAMERQSRARAELERQGIEVIEAPAEATAGARRRLLEGQARMVRRLGLDPGYVGRVEAYLGRAVDRSDRAGRVRALVPTEPPAGGRT